ncbi:facilitated trehalose transporter Tret1-like isoform X3 [Neocloeon triangulifer]|uniref:facilitated trehalose transporter Tret1-like isoform X3 n=1 Tax=Neocloeon triangulifer TaxID=2078957 RepID=UPI00286EB826|nr:facilitated trehalose transporter Tret1-like isoform X3 [Neocloeon triangulifer]
MVQKQGQNVACTFAKDAAPLSVQVISTSNNHKDEPSKSHGLCGVSSFAFRQALAASGPVVATIGSGMTSGFSAVLLPQLRASDSDLPISEDDTSWIASMAALPMALGCLAGGFSMERLGRKRTNQLLCVPFIAGWLLLAVAQNVTALLVARFLTGLAVGILGPVGLIYIGETSAPQYRGVLLAAISLAVSTGILLSHLFGALLHWRLAAALCALAPLIALILVLVSPESPAWLVAQGRPSDAQDAFRWLRGSDPEASAELQSLLHKRPDAAAAAAADEGWRSRLARPSFVKPFLLMNVFFVIQQFSGVNAVAFYTVAIFQQTLGDGVDEYLAMAVLDVARLVMSLVTCVLLRRLGRRPLALTSAAGTGLCLLLLAAFLRFRDATWAAFEWTPVALLVGYMGFVSVGLVPLPWVMTGEVFPAAVRGVGSGATSCLGFLVFFVVVKSGPAMFASMGSDGTFLLYGLVATFGGVFLYFFCPETKNRTLQEIEDAFENKTAATSTKV